MCTSHKTNLINAFAGKNKSSAHMLPSARWHIPFRTLYLYIDSSVLLGNTPWIHSYKTTSRTVAYFPYHSLRRCMIETSSGLLQKSLKQSAEIFENFPKMFGNIRVTFGQVLENVRKSSESGQKSAENHPKHFHHYVMKNITRYLKDMNFMFWWQLSLMRNCFCHSHIHIFSLPCK